MKKEDIAGILSKHVGIGKEDILNSLEKPRYHNLGDVSFPCFNLAKEYKKSPFAIAIEIESKLKFPPKGISKVQAVGGYVNFFLDKKMMAEEALAEAIRRKRKYGSSSIGKGKSIVLDFSSPNISKPMTIGHLRSTVIGNSLYRIFSFLGYKCIGINYLGDYGTQFGKLLCAYEKWGKPFDKEMRQKPIETMLRLYIKFTEESEKDPSLSDEARAWFKKLEQKDKEAVRLWKLFRKLSLKDFKRFYKILGVRFDSYSGESFYSEKAKRAIEELVRKNIAVESENALVVPFGKDEAPLLIQKADGTTLYATRDIAAAEDHHRKYRFHKKLYVVATEQNLYFRQLFSTLDRMGYRWAKDCEHVSFGMIYLPEGKVSTRKGNVIFLEDVLEKIFKLAGKFVENDKTLSRAGKEKIARAVGVSALIYGDLSNDRVRDIKFDWSKLLRLEGDSGPYLQYTYARASSILSKEKKAQRLSMPPKLTAEEETMISDIAGFTAMIEDAAAHYAPHIIANYLLKVSDHFNTFYEKCPVLTAKEERPFRIALTKAVSHVLENGMLLLGMIPLKRM